MILPPVNPGSIRLRVIRSSSSSPPARSVIQSHSAAARWSFQRIAGRITSPSASSGVRPCIWPHMPMPTTSAPPCGSCAVRSVIASPVARHHAAGSCSAQPGRRLIIG